MDGLPFSTATAIENVSHVRIRTSPVADAEKATKAFSASFQGEWLDAEEMRQKGSPELSQMTRPAQILSKPGVACVY
jgi:hypothetical protein